jgi:hypothetical protein
MTLLVNDIEFGEDCGYLDTGRVRIGLRFRDSQITSATPRVRGEVQFLGAHAERLQTALLYRPERRRVADVVLAVVLGASLAAILFFGWSA